MPACLVLQAMPEPDEELGQRRAEVAGLVRSQAEDDLQTMMGDRNRRDAVVDDDRGPSVSHPTKTPRKGMLPFSRAAEAQAQQEPEPDGESKAAPAMMDSDDDPTMPPPAPRGHRKSGEGGFSMSHHTPRRGMLPFARPPVRSTSRSSLSGTSVKEEEDESKDSDSDSDHLPAKLYDYVGNLAAMSSFDSEDLFPEKVYVLCFDTPAAPSGAGTASDAPTPAPRVHVWIGSEFDIPDTLPPQVFADRVAQQFVATVLKLPSQSVVAKLERPGKESDDFWKGFKDG